MIFIKNAYVIDPAGGREEKADILLKDGKIVKIGQIKEEEHCIKRSRIKRQVRNNLPKQKRKTIYYARKAPRHILRHRRYFRFCPDRSDDSGRECI